MLYLFIEIYWSERVQTQLAATRDAFIIFQIDWKSGLPELSNNYNFSEMVSPQQRRKWRWLIRGTASKLKKNSRGSYLDLKLLIFESYLVAQSLLWSVWKRIYGVDEYHVFLGPRFVGGGHTTFCGFLNSGVHVAMYLYYFLAALGPQVPLALLNPGLYEILT